MRFPLVTTSYETVLGLACLPVPDIMTGKMPVLLSAALGRAPNQSEYVSVFLRGSVWPSAAEPSHRGPASRS